MSLIYNLQRRNAKLEVALQQFCSSLRSVRGQVESTRCIIDNMGEIIGPGEISLYRRIGGYDVIAAIVDNLFALMRADHRFIRFGVGRSIDSRRRAQQLTVDLICSASGGPCYYMGRHMRESHAGLGITHTEWEASIEMTREALRKQSVGVDEQLEFLALFERYRSDIVEPDQ